MDDSVIRFRQAADRENRRRPVRRRYSPELQQQAVAYWRQRRGDDGVRTIAASLGVSATTLQRWTRAAATRSRFRPVAVIESAAPSHTAPLVVRITAEGARVEGLTVETAARLLTLLR
jgi:transposase-like protein